MPGWSDLEGYLGETSAALFRLAALIAANGAEPGDAEACGHAGLAYGLTGLLRSLPWHAQHGQVFLPEESLKPYNLGREDLVRGRDTPELRTVLQQVRARAQSHLDAAKALRGTIAPTSIPVFLPLATIDAYLAQADKTGWEPFLQLISLPDWRRIWLMWRWRL